MKKCALLMVLAFSLAGCHRGPKDYSYYLLHPKQAYEVSEQCGQMSDAATANNQNCTDAIQAQADFTSMLEANQADPQGFGQQILAEETTLVDAKAAVKTANKQLRKLKRKGSVSIADIKAAKAQLATVEQQLKAQKVRVQAMLNAVRYLGE